MLVKIMSMPHASLLVLVLFAMPAFAQTALAVLPSPTPVNFSKDDPRNDPSILPHLGIGHVIAQKKFARKQFVRGVLSGIYLKDWLKKNFQPKYDKILRKHPDWFDYLAQHEDRYRPAKENGPTVVNTKYEFENISDIKFGYCWGFTTLIRNFHMLAFYDPAALPLNANGQVIDPTTNRKEWIEYYEDIIDSISWGNAEVIPGFSHFRELTMVPELELYVKLKVMRIWRRLAIRAEGFGTMLRSIRDMTAKKRFAIVDELEDRLARHEMPKLNIASTYRGRKPFAISKGLHVVLVYGVKRTDDGGAVIQVWDPNFYSETLVRAPKEIVVKPDGMMVYEPWYEPGTPHEAISTQLARIEISPENDDEMTKAIRSLRRFCNDPTTMGYCK